MLVPQDQAENLLELTLTLSQKVAIKAHEYIGNHDKISGYCKYPILCNHFPKDNPEFDDLNKEVPFLAYSIPKYDLKDFPEDAVQYGAIFNGYSRDKINVSDIDGFSDLYQFISNSNELKKAFYGDKTTEISELTIKRFVSEIVERYLYSIQATKEVPTDLKEKILPYVKEKLIRYIGDSLKIDIYVPICLATFQDETIKLSDNIEIIRIPEAIQKSRKQACTYESYNEDSVAACATHMIVFHGYCFKNEEYFSINGATRNYNAYPINDINIIMAIIRIVTGYSIGYEQILSRPIDWIDDFCADLVPLYGAKTHFVNAKEYEKVWLHLPIGYINSEQAQVIQKLYTTITSLDENKTNKKLFFALKRLNRCMLRDENDDMAIDATIGLESLLSGGTKGEITYTISNRIPVVFKHEPSDTYKPNECRAIMKKIYNYRSVMVHGGILKPADKFYTINGENIEIDRIAVDFLRHALLFVINNPEYLDAKKFDEYIDSVMTN